MSSSSGGDRGGRRANSGRQILTPDMLFLRKKMCESKFTRIRVSKDIYSEQQHLQDRFDIRCSFAVVGASTKRKVSKITIHRLCLLMRKGYTRLDSSNVDKKNLFIRHVFTLFSSVTKNSVT